MAKRHSLAHQFSRSFYLTLEKHSRGRDVRESSYHTYQILLASFASLMIMCTVEKKLSTWIAWNLMWIQEENYLWNYARGNINEKFSKVFWKSQEVKRRKEKKYLLSIKHHFCRSDIEQHVIKPPLEPGANSLISDYSHSPQQPLLWNILLERRGKAYSQTHRVFTSHWTFLIMKWQKNSASLGIP